MKVAIVYGSPTPIFIEIRALLGGRNIHIYRSRSYPATLGEAFLVLKLKLKFKIPKFIIISNEIMNREPQTI